MDDQVVGAIVAGAMAQVLGFAVDKLGLRPHFQKFAYGLFFIIAAFTGAGIIYFGWQVYNPWGEVQVGLADTRYQSQEYTKAHRGK